MNDFEPFPGLSNPHLQTFFGMMSSWHCEPDSEMELLQLPDGDHLSLFSTTPDSWNCSKPTVVLMHGVCGSHRAPYLIRLLYQLLSFEMRVIRMNLRGCEYTNSKRSYHGGLSGDIFHVVQNLKSRMPETPLFLIGFSLSGNIILKLAGEMGKSFKEYVKQIIAVCPPVDLMDSAYRLQEKQNRIYQKSFLKTLVFQVEKRNFLFKPSRPLKTCKTLIDFDTLFTAPSWGFLDVFDYYKKNSSINFISEIQVPCKILIAQDDPLVNPLPLQRVPLPKNIELCISDYGGHMGFIGNPFKGKYFWMDHILIDWVKSFV